MEEKMNKGSFDDSRLEMWAPVVKSADNVYMAVLSDDSIDRDGEVVGKEAMLKIKDDKTFLAALMDHENKILNQVGEWVNRRVETINGHTTLLAEPKFFKSNPNAVIIEGMLKEGAKMGISIGAIVKSKENREIKGKSRTVFTDLELVEASFVAIPSNRHAHALAVAKSYKKQMEVKNMTEEVDQPVEPLAEEPVVEEVVEEPKEADLKIETLNKEFEVFKEASVSEKEALVKEHKESLEKLNLELEATKKALEELKASPLLKAKVEVEESREEVTIKNIQAGQLPVTRI